MAKDVNIHVKTTGTQKAAQDFQYFYGTMQAADRDIAAGLKETGKAVEDVTTKNAGLAGSFKELYTALIGPLSITAAATFVVSAVKRIIAAYDDMKRAASEAVHEMANQQKAAASFFESVNAYSGPQRTAALAQARGVQGTTGLPFEFSMKLLETQQRTFGEINPESTKQFAAYWQLHAQGPTATPDLIRWMGASGVNTPDQQSRIMRLISTVAEKSKLHDEDIITAISSRGERLRSMGWSPEETITNIGKALSGLSETESSKAMRGLLESFEGFDEAKAREMRAPPDVASNEQARFEWLKSKAQTMTPEKRTAFIRQAFGPAAAPYITKMLFEPTSPQYQKAIDYAVSPQAKAEEQKRYEEAQKTEAFQLEKVQGQGVQNLPSEEDTLRTLIEEQGKMYLENYLRTKDRFTYEKLQYLPEFKRYQKAALMLWRTTHPAVATTGFRGGSWGPTTEMVPQDWDKLSDEQRLDDLRQASDKINQRRRPKDTGSIVNIHNEHIINHYPSVGDNLKGARFGRDDV
jgi:hypothetical protein